MLYADAGDTLRAGQCYADAGDAAVVSVDLEKAKSLYTKACEAWGIDVAVPKMDLLHKLGDIEVKLGRARSAQKHFQAMLVLAWRLDLPARGALPIAGLAVSIELSGEYDKACEHLELAQVLFELADDRFGIAAAFDDLGRVKFLTGHLDQSMTNPWDIKHRKTKATWTRPGDSHRAR